MRHENKTEKSWHYNSEPVARQYLSNSEQIDSIVITWTLDTTAADLAKSGLSIGLRWRTVEDRDRSISSFH